MARRKNPADLVIWRLASVLIDPAAEHPEFWCLILEGETDVPLLKDDRIVFFKDRGKARELIGRYASETFCDEIDVDDEPVFTCDLASTLYVLSSGTEDAECSVVNAVNLLLDLVKATQIDVPEQYRSVLNNVADHFTFDKNPAPLFREDEAAQSLAISAVLWCVGAVVALATFDCE